MDSHRSVSPTRTPPTAGGDATSRSAEGDVTRRRQTDQHPPAPVENANHLEIAEFHDVLLHQAIWETNIRGVVS